MYIKEPKGYIQPELFSEEEISYSGFDMPIFFKTLIRWQFNENLYFLASPDFSYLMVSGFGVSLSKKSERLIIKNQNKSVYEVPFFRIKNIAIMSKGVGLSSDLVEYCCKYSIAISFHDFSAKPIALLQSMYAPAHGKLKYRQIQAKTTLKGINLISRIICGKIANQTAVLKYAVKNIDPQGPHAERLSAVQTACENMHSYAEKCLKFNQKDDIETLRTRLMGYEGTSARMYWKAVGTILEDKVVFSGRDYKKIPNDAVNALLNYGYGILYSKIWSSVILAGLDPYVGFLHSDESGNPALVFDLIEEFRAPLIDRLVISFIMLNRPIKIEQGFLTMETRHIFSQKLLERLSSHEYYEGEKIMVNDIILAQARRITAYLEDKNTYYKPFAYKW